MIATPRSRSIVQGIPSPRPWPRDAPERLAELALQRREQLVLAQAALGALDRVDDPPLRVQHPDEHLGSPEVDADRLGHQPPPGAAMPRWRGDLRASHAAVLPGDAGPAPTEANPAPVSAEGEQPPERPDYKVYKSRPGLLSRLRAPDLSKLRERTRRKGPDRARAARRARRSRRPARDRCGAGS